MFLQREFALNLQSSKLKLPLIEWKIDTASIHLLDTSAVIGFSSNYTLRLNTGTDRDVFQAKLNK